MEPQKFDLKSHFHANRKTLLIALPLVFALLAVTLLALSSLGIKTPIQNVSLFQQGPKVAIKEEYKNPFAKDTQYVNPFDEYKNPFVVSK